MLWGFYVRRNTAILRTTPGVELEPTTYRLTEKAEEPAEKPESLLFSTS